MIIVYSYYVLDVVHKGHLFHMWNAKALAGPNGRSFVGILTDKAVMEKKNVPILSFDERVTIAQGIEFSDVVVPQETYSPFQNIRRIQPDILIESSSHEKDLDVIAYMENGNGRIIILPYYPSQSSTSIKEKIRND